MDNNNTNNSNDNMKQEEVGNKNIWSNSKTVENIFSNEFSNMSGVLDDVGFGDVLNSNYYSLFDLAHIQQQYNDMASFLGSSNNDLDQPGLGSLLHRPAALVDLSPTGSSVLLNGECSEVVDMPTTPNSNISFSSMSSDGGGVDDHHHHAPPSLPVEERQGGKEGDVEQKDKQHEDDNSDDIVRLKPKTKKQKSEKQPRFAFITKTEVDHLDDGYRWRKYGQKAVKNSPFPRSYYRCTTPACGVKKRVERSSSDQAIVVTTYEGKHGHPCPMMTRGGINLSFGMGADMKMIISNQYLDPCSTTSTTTQSIFSRGGAPLSSLIHHQNYNHFQNQYLTTQNHQQKSYTSFNLLNQMTPSSMDFTSVGSVSANTTTDPMINGLNVQTHNLHQLKDDGLLQDMVPTQMRKNEPTKAE